MTTMCKQCSCDNLSLCLETQCPFHDTFVFKQLFTKLKIIEQAIKHYHKPKDKDISRWSDNDYNAFKLYADCDHMYEQIVSTVNITDSIITEQYVFDKCQHHWVDMRNEFIESGEYCDKCHITRPGNYDDITWRELPDYGDLMSIDEFIDDCKGGSFIDSDGHGCYVKDDKMSSKTVHPSDITSGNIDNKRFTHVMWFNV